MSLPLLLVACAPGRQISPKANMLDTQGVLTLHPIARLGRGAGDEISGIVRSRRDPGVFWTLNDSGDEPRVYPIRADGRVIESVRYPHLPGTYIEGAINNDWEDIALDSSGNLVVADLGNNTNARADLTLYFLPEPEPTAGRTIAMRRVLISYPTQKSRPAPKNDFNYDAEAVFTVGDEVYVLSKNRSNTGTDLYQLHDREPGVVNPLRWLGHYDIQGEVTGADASADGLRLAVLTYDSVWLFERDAVGTPFFEGRVHRRRYLLNTGESDSESICFENDETLLIADEAQGTLYRVGLSELVSASN